MKLKFITPKDLDRNLKATIHKSGKLGFTVDAANKLKLAVDKGMLFAVNEDDSTDMNLYVIIRDKNTDETFRVSKAGDYYYVNAKDLFDNLKIDYANDSIVFDIQEMELGGESGYVFKRRKSYPQNQ